MKSLFLAWQGPKDCDRSRAWFPIGRLDAESSGPEVVSYRFRYTGGATRAQKEVGFEPLVSFPEFEEDYTSEKLFPLFHNRVISPKRADFPEFIEWLGLSREEADPISILSVSGGTRVTVVKVNHTHAPLNQSILVEYTGKAPKDLKLMSSPDFTPLIG